jgi:hypothetical protein
MHGYPRDVMTREWPADVPAAHTDRVWQYGMATVTHDAIGLP